MLHAVIMAGGSGTRFWPESRRARPKQFLALSGERSLLQETADRCRPLIATDQMWVVTNAAYVGQTRAQLPELPPEQILAEPCARNTAPCIGLAAAAVLRRDPDARLLVMPADHVITPAAVFRECVTVAEHVLTTHPGASVLFGAHPTYPATGFGYIEQGPVVSDTEGRVFEVPRFREKPSRELAESFLAAGNYLWNCGIFMWHAATVRRLLAEFQPAVERQLKRLDEATTHAEWTARLKAEFPQMPSISIDHGVLEQASEVYVLPASFGWDDVGSWQALARLRGSDAEGNTLDGVCAPVATRGSILRSTPEHLIATFGIDNLVVVHTPDATLVTRRDDENGLRQIVSWLETHGYERYL